MMEMMGSNLGWTFLETYQFFRNRKHAVKMVKLYVPNKNNSLDSRLLALTWFLQHDMVSFMVDEDGILLGPLET